MSGTDHSKDEGWLGAQPLTVLVRPQMGENIGAAARAMWNFGLDRMRIVAPRDGWPNERAVAMASGAGRVLDNVQLTDTVAAACDELHYAYATTARARDLTKPVLSPLEAMQDARARIADGQRVGILYGPERAGLENEDVAQANALISVPVNPAFGSLNLAQCVLLVSYEWGRVRFDLPQAQTSERATTGEMDHLLARLETRLDDAGFFFPADKATSMRVNLRNMFSRLDLSSADVRILHGIVKTLGRDNPTR
jgi:tRNA/rRNA methyltransferase